MAHPTDVTDASFPEFVKTHPLAIVDCWAPWCGPCLRLAPIVESLAGDLEKEASFAKLNTDDNPQTAMRFGIMSIPTILIFKNGQRVDQVVGLVPKEALRERILRHSS
jgi:thioredoxin 1